MSSSTFQKLSSRYFSKKSILLQMEESAVLDLPFQKSPLWFDQLDFFYYFLINSKTNNTLIGIQI